MRTLIIFALVAAASAWDGLPTCGLSNVPDAGTPRTIDRIIGGWAALTHEFPYQITLLTATGSLLCGGSIIGTRHVLTAAHCTFERDPSSIYVGLGEHLLDSPNDQFVRADVTTINQHPQYNPSTIANDISVLILSQAIQEGTGRRSVCPPSRTAGGNADGYANLALIVSGWGYTAEDGSISNVLRAVDVLGYTLASCRDSNYPDYWILEGMNCAGVPAGGKDACNGDSGSPLVYKNGERFEEVGLVSWGDGCARPGYPGVYADTVYFLGWIADNM